MKKSPLPTILLGVLALSALLSLGLCWYYINESRQLRMLAGQEAYTNSRRFGFNQLVNDVVEYSKKNSQIDPLLESMGLKQKSGSSTAPTNKPSVK